MITIINYGMGNLGSMKNMFKRIGFNSTIEDDPNAILKASKLILPGVGSFDTAIKFLHEKPNMLKVLERKVLIEKIPILGVCLGMQLFTNNSEEGILPGLGWIEGETKKFPKLTNLKVPHMGWSYIKKNNKNPLSLGVDVNSKYYFVHSYYVKVKNEQHSVLKTSYGIEFDSAISKENIYGVQFHPEKSHKYGMKILQNFALL